MKLQTRKQKSGNPSRMKHSCISNKGRDNLLRRYVTEEKVEGILWHCHDSPYGRHFSVERTAAKLARVLKHYGVRHKVATPYHPQTNGQAKVSNREIKRILEKIVASSRKDYSQRLDDALLAYRTAMKTTIGLSPFQMVYGKACHLPVEMEHRALWALKFLNYDPCDTTEKRRRQLIELEEMRLHAYDSSKNNKEKLKSKWSGPFRIKNVLPHGVVELTDPFSEDQQRSWVVNGQRLKHYFGGEVERLSTIMELVDPDSV
ncbi:uncharacterized protein LOC108339326 [Vigna angularis]|uniref:uncharacterized protein LOC108339326 n=1 Tax=Phaseolus angularis TaxID=3914 RepID=UPI00080A6302|nr:uncharacterized protein LOC108339326 [Vigna angularis]